MCDDQIPVIAIDDLVEDLLIYFSYGNEGSLVFIEIINKSYCSQSFKQMNKRR
jgi:hypothetical protein